MPTTPLTHQQTPIPSPVYRRIHVGNFMARLLVENECWEQWKGKMPVLYNRA
ncbi:MAG: hypothetical protein R6V72_06415 [Cyclobacterium sp.]|uniref:hypothetical protein n=1 Tax=unclassified Cyclobacterium TaxID=2615055 RepID=UPI0013D2251A|nr:hypothetical protein [Cyclobacterium sp. SYSU L10401]